MEANRNPPRTKKSHSLEKPHFNGHGSAWCSPKNPFQRDGGWILPGRGLDPAWGGGLTLPGEGGLGEVAVGQGEGVEC